VDIDADLLDRDPRDRDLLGPGSVGAASADADVDSSDVAIGAAPLHLGAKPGHVYLGAIPGHGTLAPDLGTAASGHAARTAWRGDFIDLCL